MMPTSPVAYNPLGPVVGVAVLGSLVVALVVLFIGYRHWQKGKEHQHLAVAYSSGRLDGSEYVMPGEPARGQGKPVSGGPPGTGFCASRWAREAGSAGLDGGEASACVHSCRRHSWLQSLLLQPQLPHPVTVLA